MGMKSEREWFIIPFLFFFFFYDNSMEKGETPNFRPILYV